MAEFQVKPGSPFILSITLEQDNGVKYIKCFVKKFPTGAPIIGSPFVIPHEANGKYTLVSDGVLVFPDDGLTRELHAHFLVYDDPAFTIRSKSHGEDTDVFQGNPGFGSTGAVPSFGPSATEIIGVVEDEPLVGHIVDDMELEGELDQDEIVGVMEQDNTLETNNLEQEPTLVGIVEED